MNLNIESILILAKAWIDTQPSPELVQCVTDEDEPKLTNGVFVHGGSQNLHDTNGLPIQMVFVV